MILQVSLVSLVFQVNPIYLPRLVYPQVYQASLPCLLRLASLPAYPASQAFPLCRRKAVLRLLVLPAVCRPLVPPAVSPANLRLAVYRLKVLFPVSPAFPVGPANQASRPSAHPAVHLHRRYPHQASQASRHNPPCPVTRPVLPASRVKAVCQADPPRPQVLPVCPLGRAFPANPLGRASRPVLSVASLRCPQ